MNNYPDKIETENRKKIVQQDAKWNFGKLHPTDEAVAYRELETWAGENASKQEETNDKYGVPERGE